jgi:hypothetical protein
MDETISSPYIGRTAYQKLSIFLWNQKSNSDRNFYIFEAIKANAKRGRLNFALSEYSGAREVAGSKEICIEPSRRSEASSEKLEDTNLLITIG